MKKKDSTKIREEFKQKMLEQLEKFLLSGNEMDVIRLLESIKDPNIISNNEAIGHISEFLYTNKMFTAFNYLIKMDGFDPNFYTDFGGTFIGEFIESMYSKDVPRYKFKILKEALNNILSLNNIDASMIDSSNDNLLNVACRVGASNEIIEKLIEIGVSPNNVNDIGYTAAGDAIRHNNFEALDLLMEKFSVENLKFSENDLKLIQKFKNRFSI